MRVKIINYDTIPDLKDAITRYYVLLRLSMESGVYKICETPTSQVLRYLKKTAPAPPGGTPSAATLDLSVKCDKCGKESRLQLNAGTPQPLRPNTLAFPLDSNIFICPTCGKKDDLTPARKEFEKQTKLPAVGYA
jgi:hypothetical protein